MMSGGSGSLRRNMPIPRALGESLALVTVADTWRSLRTCNCGRISGGLIVYTGSLGWWHFVELGEGDRFRTVGEWRLNRGRGDGEWRLKIGTGDWECLRYMGEGDDVCPLYMGPGEGELLLKLEMRLGPG